MKQLRRPRTKQARQSASTETTSRKLKENPVFPSAYPIVPVSVDGEAENIRDMQLIKPQLSKQVDAKGLHEEDRYFPT